MDPCERDGLALEWLVQLACNNLLPHGLKLLLRTSFACSAETTSTTCSCNRGSRFDPDETRSLHRVRLLPHELGQRRPFLGKN